MDLRPDREHDRAPPGVKAPWRAVRALQVVLTLLLLPVLLSGGTTSAQALLRCEATRTVHASCCCPAEGAPSVASITPAPCCTLVQVDSTLPSGSLHAPSEVAPPVLAAHQPAWRGFAPLLEPTKPVHVSPQLRPLPPRTRSGPSLIVLHRRFVI